MWNTVKNRTEQNGTMQNQIHCNTAGIGSQAIGREHFYADSSLVESLHLDLLHGNGLKCLNFLEELLKWFKPPGWEGPNGSDKIED